MHQFVSLAIMRGSFGITLYEILAREDPYVGEDEGQVLVFPLPSPSLLPMLTSSASNAARQLTFPMIQLSHFLCLSTLIPLRRSCSLPLPSSSLLLPYSIHFTLSLSLSSLVPRSLTPKITFLSFCFPSASLSLSFPALYPSFLLSPS